MRITWISGIIILFLVQIVSAGPNDKWVPVESSPSFDGIALLFAVGAIAWAYVIFKDIKLGRKPTRRK